MKKTIYKILTAILPLACMAVAGCNGDNTGNGGVVFPNLVITNVADNLLTMDVRDEFAVRVDFDGGRLDIEDYELVFTSGNDAVFTVSGDGIVRPVAEGEAWLYVSLAENGKVRTGCTVKVVDALQSLEGGLVVTNAVDGVISLIQGDAFTAEVDFDEEYDFRIEDYTLKFASTDDEVFTVDPATGAITAVGEGEAFLNVGILEAEKVSGRCKVKVSSRPLPELVIANAADGVISLEAGQSVDIVLKFADPSLGEIADYTFAYSGDNDKVFTVDAGGTIAAVAAGEAWLTVSAVENEAIAARCKVKVEGRVVPELVVKEAENAVVTVVVGKPLALTLDFAPGTGDDISDYTFTYLGDNDKAFTVGADGVITPVAEGEGVLTVRAVEDEEIYTTCAVRVVVPQPSSGLVIEGLENQTLTVMMKRPVIARVSFADPGKDDISDYTPVFSGDKADVFEVDASTGEITPVAEGEGVLTVKLAENEKVFTTCVVKVIPYVPVPSSRLVIVGAEDGVLTVDRGAQRAVKAAFTDPEADDINEYTFRYSGSDRTVFTVSGTGIVTALKPGEAYLTLTAVENPEVTVSCKVRVVEAAAVPVTAIDVAYTDVIRVGMNGRFDLGRYVSLSPREASFSDIVFTSADNDVALVDEFGIVTGFKYGWTDVRISSLDGSVSRTCRVHVSYYGYQPYDRSSWTAVASQPGGEGNMFDNDNGSGYTWAKPGSGSVPKDHIPYFVLDMGVSQRVDFFTLRHRTDNTYDWLRVWEASLYGSDDGVTFTPIVENIAIPHTQGVDVNPTLEIPATTCRYVKFVCEKWRPLPNGQSMTITDFKMGIKAYYPEEPPRPVEPQQVPGRVGDFGREGF